MSVKSWLLGIFAVAVILETVLLILPEGKTGKYIKGFFLLIFALVILNPVVDVKNNYDDYQVNVSVDSNGIEYQENYLEYVVKVDIDDKVKQCELLLENCGISGGNVEIDYKRTQGVEYTVTKVSVNLKNAVIIGEDEHINIIEKAKNNLYEFLKVNDGVIVFYE